MRLTLIIVSVLLLPPQKLDLQTVLVRAAEYVRQYQREFALLICEERYLQEVTRQNEGPAGSERWSLGGVGTTAEGRKLVSEFALVRVEDADRTLWLAFRDVLEVDGRPVQDRTERLQRLFVAPPANALAQAQAIAKESARYNIGDLVRTMNVPTMGLEFLGTAMQKRSSFRKRGEETEQDVKAWVVAFEERERPTLIQTPEGQDVVTKGTIWIDPQTGRVLRTQIDPQLQRGLKTRVTVSYAPDARLGMWVPVEMKEIYELESRQITGEAKYSNYRRFETDVKLKGPKGEVSWAKWVYETNLIVKGDNPRSRRIPRSAAISRAASPSGRPPSSSSSRPSSSSCWSRLRRRGSAPCVAARRSCSTTCRSSRCSSGWAWASGPGRAGATGRCLRAPRSTRSTRSATCSIARAAPPKSCTSSATSPTSPTCST